MTLGDAGLLGVVGDLSVLGDVGVLGAFRRPWCHG